MVDASEAITLALVSCVLPLGSTKQPCRRISRQLTRSCCVALFLCVVMLVGRTGCTSDECRFLVE